MLTRRELIGRAARASAGLALMPGAAFGDPLSTATLRPAAGKPVRVPRNFIGLGYEMSSVATPGLLSAGNRHYVQLVKGLGPEGVIRVGGIVADYTRYEPNGVIRSERQNTVLTQASLKQFAGFLDAIGWTAIWSLNFAQGTVPQAVDEARAVASALGARLLAFEIGNEVENYARGQKPFRPAPYDYTTYRSEYDVWRSAILSAVPHARFAAPDTATSVEWVERMAAEARGEVQLLTTHYYRNGQARGSVEQLLAPDPRLKDNLIRLRTASEQSGIPWRMCETNSFSGGGRPGVSDTFVGALWTLDFMLMLAQSGCAGVNIETGVNQLGFISSYSPIENDGKGLNSAGVPYYGMLAFATAMRGNDQVVPAEIDAPGESVTGYALGAKGKVRSVVVINRSESDDVAIKTHDVGITRASVLRLVAPAPDSKTDIRFAGAAVDAQGSWSARTEERLEQGIVNVPNMSAAVLLART